MKSDTRSKGRRPTRRLSKSKLTGYRQCAKRLYLSVHSPELGDDSAAASAFALGHEVGGMAREVFGPGTLIEPPQGLAAALNQTAECLESRKGFPLFEGTVQAGGVLVRTDVLEKVRGGVDLVEVKASTSVKPQYIDDVAIQLWVLEAAGVKVRKVWLAHINNEFVYGGDGDYTGLFSRTDLTEEARSLQPQVAVWVKEAKTTLRQRSAPDIVVGPHCSTPYDCPFWDHCRPATDFPVECLPYGRDLPWNFMARGIDDLRKVPLEELTSEKHIRVVKATQDGKPFIAQELSQELRKLDWPRSYLDFETVSPAIPRWKGSRPYQRHPFQWSCYVERPGKPLEHHDSLADGSTDPSREFSESLVSQIPKRGPVIVYGHFEASVLTDMAKRFPELAAGLTAIQERIVDLLPLLRANYYHPDMIGSWSIKAVLPAVCPDLSYDALDEVQDGDGAQNAFLEIMSPDVAEERRTDLRTQLLEYCRMDTLAMVRLVGSFAQ